LQLVFPIGDRKGKQKCKLLQTANEQQIASVVLFISRTSLYLKDLPPMRQIAKIVNKS